MRNDLKAPAGLRPGRRKLPLSIELERQARLGPELIVPTLWLDPIPNAMPPTLGGFSEGVRSNQSHIKLDGIEHGHAAHRAAALHVESKIEIACIRAVATNHRGGEQIGGGVDVLSCRHAETRRVDIHAHGREMMSQRIDPVGGALLRECVSDASSLSVMTVSITGKIVVLLGNGEERIARRRGRRSERASKKA